MGLARADAPTWRSTRRVPWDIEIVGGVNKLQGKLIDVDLRSFEMTGGVDQLRLTLGRPTGEVPIRLTGGANHAPLRAAGRRAHPAAISGGVGASNSMARSWARRRRRPRSSRRRGDGRRPLRDRDQRRRQDRSRSSRRLERAPTRQRWSPPVREIVSPDVGVRRPEPDRSAPGRRASRRRRDRFASSAAVGGMDGRRPSGQDLVGAMALTGSRRPELLGERRGQADDRGLGRRVVGGPSDADQPDRAAMSRSGPSRPPASRARPRDRHGTSPRDVVHDRSHESSAISPNRPDCMRRRGHEHADGAELGFDPFDHRRRSARSSGGRR